MNSYTSSNTSNINAIHTATSSLNSYTSSNNTRLGVIESTTSSLNSFTSSQNTFNSAHNTATASLNSYTSSNTTNINAIHTATSSLNSFTSSASSRLGAIETATSSLNSYTSSQNTFNTAHNTATSSLNTFTSSFNSAFSLSGADVTVKGNFTVSGTTTTVNSTTVAIGDNIIQLNGSGATNAGIVVRDATSPTTTSGSLLWDTTNDKWVAGPLGSEDDIVLRTTSQTLTNKTISGASNTLSNIGNSSLTNSSISIAGNNISLGGSITAATILSGTGTVSGSAQLTSTFVQKAGDTMTGQLVIGSTGTAGAATLKINTSTATSFIHSQENFSANMTAGQTNILVIGQAGSTKNAGYLGYNWSSSASNSNFVSLGHWGADNLLRVYGDGTVYMGTVTTGVWNGTSIGTAYTDAKVTSVSAGTGISVNATTGAVTVTNSGVTSIAGTSNQITASASTGGVTLSLPQNIHTSAVPTFKAITLTSDTDSRVLNLRELGSTSGNIIQFQTSTGTNTWEIVGRSGTGATPFYIYKNSGTNTGYIFSISDGGIPNFHTALTVGGNTVYHTGNIPTWNQNTTGTAANITASSNTSLTSLANLATVGTITSGVWNGSSISTTYTDAKVTSVSAGTGVSVNQTTGAVTVSIGQAVATNSSPTFADTTLTGGLTVGGSLSRGTYTAASNYVTGADNIVLKGNSSGVSGIFFESEKDGTNINHPSDFAFIQFHSYGIGGSTGEANRLVIGASNDADDLIVLNPMANDGVKVRVGVGTTEYSVYHSGNLTNLNQLTNGPGYITGNQSISISGDASGSGTTSISLTVSQIQGRAFRNTGSNEGVNANSLDANGTTYVTNVDGSSTNLTGNATDGALYSQVYSSSWQHQIYGDYRTGIMYARGKNNGTWQSWKRVALSNSTTFSNVSSVTFTHNLGTANLTAQVFDSSNNMFFPSEINITSTTVTVTFAANRTGRLVVTG